MAVKRLQNFNILFFFLQPTPHLQINSKLTATIVQKACSNAFSSLLKLSTFNLAIIQTSISNAAVDRKQFSTAHHFDDEDFKNGRDLITKGIASVKVSIKKGNYLSARSSLGAVCHTLQVSLP